jgi:hypothetical protein
LQLREAAAVTAIAADASMTTTTSSGCEPSVVLSQVEVDLVCLPTVSC